MIPSCEESPSFISSATPKTRKRDASTRGESTVIENGRQSKRPNGEYLKFCNTTEENERNGSKKYDKNSSISVVQNPESVIDLDNVTLPIHKINGVENESDCVEISEDTIPCKLPNAKNEDESGHILILEKDLNIIDETKNPYVDLSIAENCNGEIQLNQLNIPREFDPYLFIKFLPPYEEIRPLDVKMSLLPKKKQNSKKNTLVLDLDETLVHCTVDAIPNADHKFVVRFNQQDFNVHARKRPHLDNFLDEVSKLFEVVVFTASQRVYAEALLDKIDPENKFIVHRLYRDSCLEVDGNYLKDLNVLGRGLNSTILVDNSPYAYGYQISNGVPIESWFDDDEDECLTELLPLLSQLANEDDVRPLIEKTFNTQEMVDKAQLPSV